SDCEYFRSVRRSEQPVQEPACLAAIQPAQRLIAGVPGEDIVAVAGLLPPVAAQGAVRAEQGQRRAAPARLAVAAGGEVLRRVEQPQWLPCMRWLYRRGAGGRA